MQGCQRNFRSVSCRLWPHKPSAWTGPSRFGPNRQRCGAIFAGWCARCRRWPLRILRWANNLWRPDRLRVNGPRRQGWLIAWLALLFELPLLLLLLLLALLFLTLLLFTLLLFLLLPLLFFPLLLLALLSLALLLLLLLPLLSLALLLFLLLALLFLALLLFLLLALLFFLLLALLFLALLLFALLFLTLLFFTLLLFALLFLPLLFELLLGLLRRHDPAEAAWYRKQQAGVPDEGSAPLPQR